MSKEADLIEPFAVREILVDGFTNHVAKDGVMRCIGFREQEGRRVIVIRLAWPEVNTQAAIEEAMNATVIAPVPTPRPMRRKVH